MLGMLVNFRSFPVNLITRLVRLDVDFLKSTIRYLLNRDATMAMRIYMPRFARKFHPWEEL